MKRKVYIRICIVSLLLLFFGFSCRKPNNSVENFKEKNELTSELLSYELSFGSEIYGTPDELLLTGSVSNPAVNSKGDYVFGDEYSLKVFNAEGKGIKRFGQKGYGPGDFSYYNPILFINPSDFIAVRSSLFKEVYSIYSPDFKFITMETFRLPVTLNGYIKEKMKCDNIDQGRGGVQLQKIWAYNENEIVFELALKDRITGDYFVFCFYRNNELYKPLLLFKDPNVFIDLWYTTFSSDVGNSFIFAMPDRKIMYFSSEEDSLVSESEAYYKLHIMSIITGEDITIKQKYTPVRYPDPDAIEDFYKKGYGKRYKEVILRNHTKAQIKYYKNREYIPSVRWITVDGNFVFVFLKRQFRTEEIFRVKENYDVDVFDMRTLKYITTVTFPEIYKAIKNGYVYLNGFDKEGFNIINKYKLDPSVYGLPEDPNWRIKK